MDIRCAGEALFIACQMEKRAIRLYERALAVFADGACQDAVRDILAEERNHLNQFSQMGADTPDFERAQLLSAKAAGVLFSGGLTEAQRKGAFERLRGPGGRGSDPAIYGLRFIPDRKRGRRLFRHRLRGKAAPGQAERPSFSTGAMRATALRAEIL